MRSLPTYGGFACKRPSMLWLADAVALAAACKLAHDQNLPPPSIGKEEKNKKGEMAHTLDPLAVLESHVDVAHDVLDAYVEDEGCQRNSGVRIERGRLKRRAHFAHKTGVVAQAEEAEAAREWTGYDPRFAQAGNDQADK